jgi:hypothetical protein
MAKVAHQFYQCLIARLDTNAADAGTAVIWR